MQKRLTKNNKFSKNYTSLFISWKCTGHSGKVWSALVAECSIGEPVPLIPPHTHLLPNSCH